jgi:hypothetical protein
MQVQREALLEKSRSSQDQCSSLEGEAEELRFKLESTQKRKQQLEGDIEKVGPASLSPNHPSKVLGTQNRCVCIWATLGL